MGAFRGSITYRKFHVEGELGEGFRDRFIENARLRVFRPLDPNEEVDQRAGWCAPGDPYDLELEHQKVFYNDYLVLGLRVDKWRIPTPLFRAAFREAEQAHLAKHGLAKLGRAQKKNLEAMVVARLRRKLVPAMRVTDVCWHLDRRELRLFTRSGPTSELMVELFEKTFTMALVPDGAYVAAEQRELPKRRLDALPKLEPALFHTEEA